MRYEKFSILDSKNQAVMTGLSEDEAREAFAQAPTSYRIACDGYSPAYAPGFKLEYSSVQTILPTPLGPVALHVVSGDHIMVDSNASSGYGGGDLMYDGFRWYANMHLYLASGWDEDPCSADISSARHEFSVAGSLGNGRITPKRRAAIVLEVRMAVITFLADHPEFLALAEVNDAKHETERAMGKWAEAQEAEAAAKTRYQEADYREASALAALSELGLTFPEKVKP